MLVTLLNQGKNLVYELEPAHGDQTACEGLVDKTLKQIGIALNFDRIKESEM